jgi:hypothetical protein
VRQKAAKNAVGDVSLHPLESFEVLPPLHSPFVIEAKANFALIGSKKAFDHLRKQRSKFLLFGLQNHRALPCKC